MPDLRHIVELLITIVILTKNTKVFVCERFSNMKRNIFSKTVISAKTAERIRLRLQPRFEV